MNIPNILTMLRFVLAGGFYVMMGEAGLASGLIAAGLFALAAFTDFYDGYLARKYNLITDFGKIMDPIADKLLILLALYVFVRMDVLFYPWMFYCVFAREVLVTVSRLIAVRRGKVLAAEAAGKVKTVLQMTVISAALIFVILCRADIVVRWPEAMRDGALLLINMLMAAATLMTLISGALFYWNNRKTV